MLQPMNGPRISALRTRLDKAHCVFDFVVLAVGPTVTPAEAEHRMALGMLFDAVQEQARQWQRSVIEKHPEYANHRWPDWSPNLPQARAEQLDAAAVSALAADDGALCQAFRDPPYGTDLQVADFHEWLQVLRLHPDEEMQVLDWVGDGWNDPQRSAWSDYFDAGREWWGIWCLTLYNPRRHTLSALAASATD